MELKLSVYIAILSTTHTFKIACKPTYNLERRQFQTHRITEIIYGPY